MLVADRRARRVLTTEAGTRQRLIHWLDSYNRNRRHRPCGWRARRIRETRHPNAARRVHRALHDSRGVPHSGLRWLKTVEVSDRERRACFVGRAKDNMPEAPGADRVGLAVQAS